jgi:osmotically-inducible protein OsmY
MMRPMKKLSFLLISSLLVLTAACTNNPSRTSETAPNNANVANTEVPSAAETKAAQQDAQSELRRRQLNQDIRAREQRNDALNSGSSANRAQGDIASEVRSKLEANIPRSSLTVAATKDGTVTVGGTVTNQQELNKIAPLAKEIKGVKNVVVKATVAQPTPR